VPPTPRVYRPLPINIAASVHRRPSVELFHYTTPAGLLGIASERKIWATHVQFLNDATELRHAVDLIVEDLDRRKGITSPSGLLVLDRAKEFLRNRVRSYLAVV